MIRFLFTLVTSILVAHPSHLWLENSKDTRTQKWIEEQNSLFQEQIGNSSLKDKIRSNLQPLMNNDSYSFPNKFGDQYFYVQSKTGQGDILCMRNGLKGASEIILDLREQPTTHIYDFSVSPDGHYLTYETTENGSDWITCHILDLHSLQKMSDEVGKIKFSGIVWSLDSQGFFYSCFDSEIEHSIRYHVLTESQDKDRIIYQKVGDQSVGYSPYASSDQRYLIIDAYNGSSGPNGIFCIDLNNPEAEIVQLLPCDDSDHYYISNQGTKFYFLTTKNAPMRKVICLDIENPEVIEEVIPESDSALGRVVPIGDFFGVIYTKNGTNQIQILNNKGKLIHEIPLPSSSGKLFFYRSSQNLNDEFFFSFESLLQPTTIYRYSILSNTCEPFYESAQSNNSEEFELKQIFYTSEDGTKIPMTILHKKELPIDGNIPTLLTGYGAYGISYYPPYNPSWMLWLKQGGVIAIAHVRGGGECGGEKWHEAGIKANKQNSFSDFIAAAKWLIDHGYTKPNRLACIGCSAGGLLVAASVNQRPDLFGAAVVRYGFLDLLRFHLFPPGIFWIKENGHPERPFDFDLLCKYSPCHNVQSDLIYPPILVVTSENDTRVVPSHSYKYLAALQEKKHPAYLFLSPGSGHCKSNVDEDLNILIFLINFLEPGLNFHL